VTSPRSLPLVALALAVAVLVVQARVIAGGKTWDDVRYHTEIAPPRLAAACAKVVCHRSIPRVDPLRGELAREAAKHSVATKARTGTRPGRRGATPPRGILER